MNTHQITAPESSARRAGGLDPVAGARLQAGPAAVPSEVDFGCPVCGASLRVTRGLGKVAGVCPVCHSGVVAPQPELGCLAMTYRDWLRMQEIQWDERPPTARPIPRPSESLGPRRARSMRAPRGLVPWAAAGALATVLGLGGWMGRPDLGTIRALIPSMMQAPPQPVGVTPPGAPAPVADPTAAVSLPATTPSAVTASGGTTLAAVMNRSAPSETRVIVRATQVHDFARSAPPADGYLCLKLTDATATARVYAPLGDAVATTAKALLPWGGDRRVTACLRWQQADPAIGVAGHWRLVSLEDAPAALTLAR